MPGLAAVVGPMIGGMTMAGVAQGAMIAGTALSAVGMVTGNKTLTKIGMGIGLAGGVGSIASGMRGASAVASVGGKSPALLNANAVESSLTSATPGMTNSKGINFQRDSAMLTNYKPSTASASGVGGPTFNPDVDKSIFQRASDTLTKYNMGANILGGMGDAYMANESMQLRRDLLDKEIKFQQKNIDWQQKNNSTPIAAPPIDVARNSSAYLPLLRR